MSHEFPLHSPDFYRGDPYPAYAALRAESPVHWCPHPEHGDEFGFWAITKYDDVRYISTNPGLFCSSKGITIPEPEVESAQLDSLIFQDPPRHVALRKLISQGFTPRQVQVLEPKIREVTASVFEGLPADRPVDFAEQVAAPLPTQVIAELIGAPSEDWEKFRAWSDAAVGSADEDIEMDPDESRLALHEYFSEIIEQRRNERRADVISTLLDAEVEGEQLTHDDLYNFCWLLLIAGNETTRNLIALGTLALMEHPDQREALVRDQALIPGAVEEMLRWVSPVTHMARTATTDVELRGQTIREGDVVVMLYGAANRDEEVFGPDAEEFVVTRTPNPHLAFGVGEHFCLGASLARLEARVMFEELLQRHPNLTLAGDVARLRATMVPGVKRMPVTLGGIKTEQAVTAQ